MENPFKYKLLIRLLIVSVAVHLLYTNSKLLLVSATDEYTLFIVVFALSYSIMTALLLELYPRITAITFVALLDGAGVFLEKSPHGLNIQVATALYFAVYTFYIILVVGLISKQRKQVDNTISELKSEIEQLTEAYEKLNQAHSALVYDNVGYKETKQQLMIVNNELNETANKLQQVREYVSSRKEELKFAKKDNTERQLVETIDSMLNSQN